MLKQAELQKAFRKFEDLFTLMDSDNDGLLNYEEFVQSFETPEVEMQLALLDFKPEQCKMLFELLDEGDGTLTIEEFFEGLSQMKGEAQAKDVFMLSKRVDQIWRVICQAAAENSEDTSVIAHSLGVTPIQRGGSLLRRARGKIKAIHDSHTPLHAKSDEKQGPLCFPAVTAPQTPDRLDLLLVGLESLRDEVGNVNQQMQTLSARIESVEQNTQTLAKSMSEMSAPRVSRSQWSQGVAPGQPTPAHHNGKPLTTPCETFFSKR